MRHTSGSSFKLVLLCTAVLLCFNSRAHAAFINAGASATDFGSPSTFAFDFSIATAPLAGLFTSTLTISGALTDSGTNGVSIGLGTLPAIAQAVIENVGVIDLGPISSTAGAYGPFTLSTIVDSADYGGTIDFISLRVSWLGSGDGDTFSFTASHTLDPFGSQVPVPATLALFGIGLAGLGWSRRKKA